MPRKPTLPGKNTSRNIPKAFRSSGIANHSILCSWKTMAKEAKNYAKSRSARKSDGQVTFEEPQA